MSRQCATIGSITTTGSRSKTSSTESKLLCLWLLTTSSFPDSFSHFTTTVNTGPKSNYTFPVPLHFVHHRSPREDAVPLLFSHGWPGSFLEVSNIIDGLTNPPNDSLPAFHVVAPSIPGFGFSPAPTQPGLGNHQAAHAFNALMQQLNYTRYVVQGGDFGSVILRYIAASYPENVISALANFYIVPPNATDWKRYHAGETTDEENESIEDYTLYLNTRQGYRIEQSTRPLALAIALTDSPLGNAMWIYDLMAAEPHVWTPEEIITWTMIHHIQGPYGGLRYYLEAEREVSEGERHFQSRESTPDVMSSDREISHHIYCYNTLLSGCAYWFRSSVLTTPRREYGQISHGASTTSTTSTSPSQSASSQEISGLQ